MSRGIEPGDKGSENEEIAGTNSSIVPNMSDFLSFCMFLQLSEELESCQSK